MRLTVLGSGDAFGSGGRFNTCFHLARDGAGDVLIDCGATSMVALRRAGIAPNTISTIFVSHLHGDHFGGLPFFLLDARHAGSRTEALTIAGPPGTGDRLQQAMEVLFPGSSEVANPFDLSLVELTPGETGEVDALQVLGLEVDHPSGAPSLALRIACAGRVIAYSGDTQWTEALVDISRDADLFLCECYGYDRPVKFHLDHATLARHLCRLTARRVVLTHMGPAMLEHSESLDVETAFDGLEIDL